MDEQSKIEQSPRADSLVVESGDMIHDKWVLHKYAFEYENKPLRFASYHQKRKINGELMEGYYDEFIPVVYDSGRGNVLKKKVELKTTYCPECNVPARKYDGDTMCPECGLLCNQTGSSQEILRDAKSAGRINSSEVASHG